VKNNYHVKLQVNIPRSSGNFGVPFPNTVYHYIYTLTSTGFY